MPENPRRTDEQRIGDLRGLAKLDAMNERELDRAMDFFERMLGGISFTEAIDKLSRDEEQFPSITLAELKEAISSGTKLTSNNPEYSQLPSNKELQ